MPLDAASPILTLTNTQAKELAGRLVTIGMETYFFKDYDRAAPGQPPWRSGAEGKAFPLLGFDQSVAAYMKFFTRPTPKRLARTAWLIAQQIHGWLPGLVAAPMVWGDTRHSHRPDDTPMDLAGYLARAVPGRTWLELKASISDNSAVLHDELRWRCVRDLLVALAALEEEGIMHGDLSPNNIVVDIRAATGRPALYLIDFDAFVAPAAGENGVISVAEGGTYGTEGYCPVELAAAAAEGDGTAAPRSDRYGRDMVLFEFMTMDCGLSADDPPASWDGGQLQLRYAAARARSREPGWSIFPHLDPATLFSLKEEDRPSSLELAAALQLPPSSRPARYKSRVRAFTPIVLGQPISAAPSGQLTRQWAPARPGTMPLHSFVPWRWSRAAADPFNRTFWQDLKAASILAIPFLIMILIGILSAIFGRR